MTKIHEYILTICVLLCVVFVIFTPATITFTRLENFVLPIAIVLLALAGRIRIEISILCGLVVFFAFSLVTFLINDLPIGLLSYEIRTVKYILFFALALNVVHKYPKAIDIFLKSTVVLVGAIMAVEILNPSELGEELYKFYSPRESWEFFQRGSLRIIGSMKNPNDNGVVLVCLSAYFMSAFYYFRNKVDLLFIAICALLIMFAQSRTSMIAFLAVGGVFVLHLKITKQTLIGFATMAFVGVLALYFFKADYLMEVFTMNPMDIGEFTGRFPAWEFMLAEWENNKILGVGPFVHKMDAFRNAPDSEYIYILASKGILGLIVYLGLLLTPVIVLWKYRLNEPHALLGILLPVAFILVAVSNFTILTVRVAMLYYFLLALAYSGLLINKNYRMAKSLPGLNLIKEA